MNGAAARAARCLALGLLLSLAPASAGAYQERLILAVKAGACTLRLEADDDARALRLRVLPEDGGCRVSREEVQALLRRAFSKTDPPRLEGAYATLFLGRLADFPWLSEWLASAAAGDGRWDRQEGRAVGMGNEACVAALLSEPRFTEQLEPALRDAGYRIRGATVEKVLVRDAPEPGAQGARSRPGRVPYDAMVWLRLERTAGG